MPVSRLRAALIGACAILVSASCALAADPYYKGKRLSIMVNYAAGGPTDIEGRLFARHIARHLEGQPSIIVQNIDGAGGLTGTTWLGEIAPKDGTAMGYLTGAAWLYASFALQSVMTIMGLGIAGQLDRLAGFVAAFIATTLVTIAASAVYPAVGPWVTWPRRGRCRSDDRRRRGGLWSRRRGRLR